MLERIAEAFAGGLGSKAKARAISLGLALRGLGCHGLQIRFVS